MLRRTALATLVLALPLQARAAQPQFWRIEGARDFLDGETEGLSVDSEGRVRLAPATKALHDPEAPYVWCLARDEKGTIYAGTGNEGKVFKIEGDKATLFYDAPELEVQALAIGPDGRLYVGTSPEGKVYAIDKAGIVETFYDPSDKYIWALAFDHQGNLLVATGAEGRIHRVDSKGKGRIVFTGSETHIITLAVDGKGNVYAGSSPGGIVYRLDAALKVFVLYDSPYREVKALDVGADGSIYAALVEGKERDETARPPAALPPTPAIPTGEVTVGETFTLATAPTPSPGLRPADLPRPGPAAKGAVLRLLPTGELETLWSSTEEMPHSLVWAEGGVLVGTGNRGKLYRIKDERNWTMITSFPSEQVTALRRDASGAFLLATSNPGRVYRLEGAPGTAGTFTSKPKDTDTVSGWGRLRWEADVPAGAAIQITSRSGNTTTPDSTWTEWSAAYTKKEGDPVTSERARFLQVRALLTGKAASPVLDSVTTAYLQRNLRPQVQSVTVHPPGEIFQKPLSLTGEVEILGLDPGEGADARPPGAVARPNPMTAAITAYSRKLFQRGIQTFSWKADDPNGDTLVYEVSYRLVADVRFRLLRKGLTEAVLAWDTSTVPNGRYVVKVTAWDTPGNPGALALAGEKESDPFDIDNTPPVVTASLVEKKPARIRVVARDDTSMIRKADYSVDGGRWQEVHPVDGINDSIEETFEIAPGELPGPGPHVVVVRAADQLGNVATARIEIP